jgi:rubrerythrin
MNLAEAFKTALEFEYKVQATYQEARLKSKDPAGQRVFSVLADEEKGHVDYLTASLERFQKTGELSIDELVTAVPDRDRIRQGLATLKGKIKDRKEAKPAEIALLQRALQAELETSAFYKKLVSESAPEGKPLFARFLEIEEGHVAIVQAQLDAVSGLGYWFDVPEWHFRDG